MSVHTLGHSNFQSPHESDVSFDFTPDTERNNSSAETCLKQSIAKEKLCCEIQTALGNLTKLLVIEVSSDLYSMVSV